MNPIHEIRNAILKPSTGRSGQVANVVVLYVLRAKVLDLSRKTRTGRLEVQLTCILRHLSMQKILGRIRPSFKAQEMFGEFTACSFWFKTQFIPAKSTGKGFFGSPFPSSHSQSFASPNRGRMTVCAPLSRFAMIRFSPITLSNTFPDLLFRFPQNNAPAKF